MSARNDYARTKSRGASKDSPWEFSEAQYNAAMNEIDVLREHALLADVAICRALDENGELVGKLTTLEVALVKWKRLGDQTAALGGGAEWWAEVKSVLALVPDDEWRQP